MHGLLNPTALDHLGPFFELLYFQLAHSFRFPEVLGLDELFITTLQDAKRMTTRARDQLGTPGGAKSFPRGAQFF